MVESGNWGKRERGKRRKKGELERKGDVRVGGNRLQEKPIGFVGKKWEGEMRVENGCDIFFFFDCFEKKRGTRTALWQDGIVCKQFKFQAQTDHRAGHAKMQLVRNEKYCDMYVGKYWKLQRSGRTPLVYMLGKWKCSFSFIACLTGRGGPVLVS